MVARNGTSAANKSLTISKGYGGMCLKFVRICWGVDAKYPSAKTAWAKAKKKHRSLDNAPVGVPVFMSHPKSVYGHVAVYLGAGKMRSTNSSTGRVTTYKISTWESWGYTVQGWTEDLNGVNLPVKPLSSPPPKKPSPPKKPVDTRDTIYNKGDKGVRVKHLQEELNRVFPKYSRLKIDGKYGPATEAVIKEFQRRVKINVDGVVGPKTTAELNKLGIYF